MVSNASAIRPEDEFPPTPIVRESHIVAGSPGASFDTMMRFVHTHRLVTDVSVAATLLFLSTVWLVGIPEWRLGAALLQCGLVVPLVARRARPLETFLLICTVAFVQWLLGYQLLADLALLIGLYTVAAYQSTARSLVAATILETGAVIASIKWEPAGTITRSLLFLSATVVASVFAGRTVASGRRYLSWLDERARRLEKERDQQAEIAALAERTRIARELHDIVSHSLSVVITLADAAALVNRSNPERGSQAMFEVSEVGRSALSDMRAMLGVLRTDDQGLDLAPQPKLSELADLLDRVRATGLAVRLCQEGDPFALGDAVELTLYRIVQEALTNTIRHAGARNAWVEIRYSFPDVHLVVSDDGTSTTRQNAGGHGIRGMRERAALHGGVLDVGALESAGWSVATTLRTDDNAVRAGVGP
jgi:signal transduction histidine kinase